MRVRDRMVLALASVLIVSISTGQEQTKPCSSDEAKQFDFWLGDWELTWTGKDGKTLHGTNSITRMLGGCVIREEFNDPSTGFSGVSVSMYDQTAGRWKQTWVDNSGSYLDFVGDFKDGRMVLHREAGPAEKRFLQRMQWYNITPDALDWNWERSDDGGATWKVLWQIHYERKPVSK